MYPLLLHFSKYNLGFHLKIFVSKSPMDETLTLDFRLLHEDLKTLTIIREIDRERERDQVQM
jgi:hypothetical protein